MGLLLHCKIASISFVASGDFVACAFQPKGISNKKEARHCPCVNRVGECFLRG